MTARDWATTPNAARKSPMRTLTLPAEGWAALDALAAEDGATRSGELGLLVEAETARRKRAAKRVRK